MTSTRPCGVLMFAVLALVGACTPIGKMPHDMTAAIESATTKADHDALARHYQDEAKALQANENLELAKQHTELAAQASQ